MALEERVACVTCCRVSITLQECVRRGADIVACGLDVVEGNRRNEVNICDHVMNMIGSISITSLRYSRKFLVKIDSKSLIEHGIMDE